MGDAERERHSYNPDLWVPGSEEGYYSFPPPGALAGEQDRIPSYYIMTDFLTRLMWVMLPQCDPHIQIRGRFELCVKEELGSLDQHPQPRPAEERRGREREGEGGMTVY